MRVSVIGTGYVGLVTGTCFAATGNDVICVDVDERKIENLKQGIIPIYEPGLEEMVKEAYEKGYLTFTTDIKEALKKTDIIFIAVGTPMGEDGSADLQYVVQVAKDIGKYMDHEMFVVDKSTVPVGTGDKVKATIQTELSNRGADIPFFVISNPEFLKEGTACDDFMHPDRVVIGSDDEKALGVMRTLYAPFLDTEDRFVAMDIHSAELTKYAANAMLATKISFINEVSNIAERVGADINKVRLGISMDTRIGNKFLNPGCGFGGSCFPKDVKALIKTSKEYGYTPALLESVEGVNVFQKKVLFNKVVAKYGENLKGKVFAIWGLAFKPGTDDMREAPCIPLVQNLIANGATLQVYDPKAMEVAKSFYFSELEDSITYMDSKYDALNGAEALFLVTEWKEFKSPDFAEVAKRMQGNVVYDGRNIYQNSDMQKYGLEHVQIGVKQ